LGISPEYRKSLVLRWSPTADIVGSLGYIDSWGKAWLGDAWYTLNRLGKPEVGEQYLQTVADLIGGTVRRYEKGGPQVMGPDGKGVDVTQLLKVDEDWKQAMLKLITAAGEPDWPIATSQGVVNGS
jgi:hypothetical protein